MQGIREAGFTYCTPIQAQTLPLALSGRDVAGQAQTGTGKTAAFLLPLLQHLLERPQRCTRALILTPTRELAQQIDVVFRGLAAGTGMRSALVVGGVAASPQERALRAGFEVVVATPGRLLDHLRNGHARLTGLRTLVLDEADQMFDMGQHLEHGKPVMERRQRTRPKVGHQFMCGARRLRGGGQDLGTAFLMMLACVGDPATMIGERIAMRRNDEVQFERLYFRERIQILAQRVTVR